MKISAGRADNFLSKPDKAVRAVLLYGPDSGLVRERGHSFAKRQAGDDDNFAITEISGDALKKDGALLSDSSRSLSLMSDGDPVVRVRDIADACTPIIESWLDDGAGLKPAVFEAGELAPRSKLRQLFEKRDDAAAIGCYADEGQSLEAVIRQHLSQGNHAIDHDAMALLASRLGADRYAVRQELDKLLLYKGNSEEAVTITDVDAVIGDVKSSVLGDLAMAVGGGNLPSMMAMLSRARAEDLNAVAILRAVQRHFDRLLTVQAEVSNGARVEDAMKRLRPPVFFKQADGFSRQARNWPVSHIHRALNILLDAERDCKSGLSIDVALCERALTQITQVARRQSR